MRVRTEKMRQQIFVFELGIRQEIVLFAFRLGEQRVFLGVFLFARFTHLDIKDLVELIVDL